MTAPFLAGRAVLAGVLTVAVWGVQQFRAGLPEAARLHLQSLGL
ncbi:hypothetical protein ACIF8T_39550 [Streptomyces sp. NPDC085946]